MADAVRLGADAVGYTLCVGTPAQEQDFAQYRQVRADAERLGMPLIVWAYRPESRPAPPVSTARASPPMEAGATGLIFGRNVWQRDHDDSLRVLAVHQVIRFDGFLGDFRVKHAELPRVDGLTEGPTLCPPR